MATRNQLALELTPELKNNGILSTDNVVDDIQSGGANNVVSAETMKTRDTDIQQQLDDRKPISELDVDVIIQTNFKQDGTSIVLEKHFVNLSDNSSSNKQEPFPLSSPTNAGLMAAESVVALGDALIRISVLEDDHLEFATTTELAASATQSQIQSEFEATSGITGEASNATRLLSIPTGLYWRWATSNTTWLGAFNQNIMPFTNNTLGTIRGRNLDGKVYAEADGSGSIVGWDILKSRVTQTEDDIITGDANTLASAESYVDNLPIPAYRIDSGILSIDRIPNMNAAKVTTGTFAAARIPSLDASIINTGIFDAGRIPALQYVPQNQNPGDLGKVLGIDTLGQVIPVNAIDPTKIVTIDTTQNISGNKLFTYSPASNLGYRLADINDPIGGSEILWSGLYMGAGSPNAIIVQGDPRDSTANKYVSLAGGRPGDGAVSLFHSSVGAHNFSPSNAHNQGTPYARDSGADLGSSVNRWKSLYLSSSISNGAQSYTVPTSTSGGLVATTTYAQPATGGTIKARFDSSTGTLYITTNGTNA